MLDSEKLRGGVRIEMKCGKRALEDYNQKYDNVRKISGALAVKQNEVAEGVDRLLDTISDLKFKITGLKKQAIESKVLSFENKVENTCVFESDLEIKELQIYADALYKTYGGVRAVLSGADNGFSFAICGEATVLDEFFKNLKAEFNVKGGGRNGMVQGTVCGNKENIEKFFNS